MLDHRFDSDYKLNKHRFLELKHYCAQYENWEAIIKQCNSLRGDLGFDPTGQLATQIAYCKDRMRPIDEVLEDMFPGTIAMGRGRDYFSLRHTIFSGSKPYPDEVYNYRKFFWLLDKKL